MVGSIRDSEDLAQGDPPHISVVIATRNRGGSIVPGLTSILANSYGRFDVIVIDQSDDDRTAAALAPFVDQGALTYVRSGTKGLGVAHNLAIAQTRGPIVAMTDDDTTVPANWLSEIERAFRLDQRIGLVFGNVYPCKYDRTAGYVPVFVRAGTTLLTGLGGDLRRGLGIGACFAIRRTAWQAVHGFDEMLGPGAPRGSLEDRDMAIRLLAAGYYVYHSARIRVVHYGFRPHKDLRRLAYQDWFGFGTSYAKYLKCGLRDITPYMLRQMWVEQALYVSLRHLVMHTRIGRLTPVCVFWIGMAVGLMTPVDIGRGHFRPKRRAMDRSIVAPTAGRSVFGRRIVAR